MSAEHWSDSQGYFWSLCEMYDYARLYDVFTTLFKVFQVITRKNPESVLCAEKLNIHWTQNALTELIDYRGLEKEGWGSSLEFSTSLEG